MKKVLSVGIILLLLVVTGCSCSKKEEKEKAVQQLSITLEGNPTTGYEWTCKADSTDILTSVSDKYTAYNNNEEITGSGGTYEFIFKGNNSGMTTILCEYKRSFEKIEPLYKIQYQVQVSSEKGLTVANQKGTYSTEQIPTPIIK